MVSNPVYQSGNVTPNHIAMWTTDGVIQDSLFPITYLVASQTNYVYNIKAFGAKGDGITDDTVAIQNALTAGAGNAVFAPPGTYLVSANMFIYSGTYFFGCGPATIFQMSALSWGALPPSSQPNSAYIMFSNYGGSAIPNSDVNIIIRDMWLKGNPYATSTAWGTGGSLIRFIGVTGFQALNLRFSYNNIGIGVVASFSWVIDGIIHDNLAGFVTSVWWGSKHGIMKNIVGTTNEASTGSGVIQINAANNAGTGSNLVTEDIDVSGWSFTGVGNAPLQMFPLGDSGGNIVQNVRVRGFSINMQSGSSNAAIDVTGVCRGIVISNFTAEGINYTAPLIVVQFYGSSSYYPTGVTISNGHFLNCSPSAAAGLIQINNANDVVLSNFTEYNCSYYQAISLPATTSNIICSNVNLNSASSQKYYEPALELLDYLTGSFTPVLNFGGSPTGWTLSIATATWVRRQLTVTVIGTLTVSAVGTATGNATITGFPYGTSVAAIAVVPSYNLITFTGVPYAVFSGATLSLFQQNASSQLTNSNFAVGSVVNFTVEYEI